MTRTSRRIEVSDADPRVEWVQAARSALEGGALALFPTECGYALGARGDDARAIERLREATERRAPAPFTWAVSSTAALGELGEVSALARRLATRYWPGPLTLVLPGNGLHPLLEAEGWIGVRCVAHAATTGILAALPFPVAFYGVRTRAGRSVEAEAADVATRQRAAVVFDGGRARLAEPPSVARVGRGRFELLREGLVDLRQLRQAAGLRIGFVCTGNTCRSPMAEGLARVALAERLGCRVDELGGFGFELVSMGVNAVEGDPASKHTQSILEEAGIDASAHRARVAQAQDLARFDHLYCMTSGHLDALVAILPPKHAKHAQLLDPEGRNISDPIGGPREVYRRTAEQIRQALATRVREWA